MQADMLIVGAGFYGTTVAERLASAGLKVLVIDKRPHIGGNCYSEIDADTGIESHKYGSHIFHTSNEKVWEYLSRFTQFNEYRHTVWTTYKNRSYSMPINLATINSFYGMNLKPFEVESFIKKERQKENIQYPSNLEEKAVSLIGRPLYEAFIRGYTIKQWEKDPKELSPDIITRLPVRYSYVNRYFDDKYEGIPLNGYTTVFKRMLDHRNIEVRLNSDYFQIRDDFGDIPTLYTGPIDRFFNYEFGRLDWRTIRFERQVHNVTDYQGCTVMNYADPEISITRIHEFKHFHPERSNKKSTVIFKESSFVAGQVDDPYYPVNTPRNARLLKRYQEKAKGIEKLWFGGRLGTYRYFDMDDTIENALALADHLLMKIK